MVRSVKNDDFKMAVTILNRYQDYDNDIPVDRYLVAVSFHIATESHTYPRTCFTDVLSMEELLNVLEAPRDYAYSGGYQNPDE